MYRRISRGLKILPRHISYAATLALLPLFASIGFADTVNDTHQSRLDTAYRACVNSGLQPGVPSFAPCILHMQRLVVKQAPQT
jgi:hypothetical protein